MTGAIRGIGWKRGRVAHVRKFVLSLTAPSITERHGLRHAGRPPRPRRRSGDASLTFTPEEASELGLSQLLEHFTRHLRDSCPSTCYRRGSGHVHVRAGARPDAGRKVVNSC